MNLNSPKPFVYDINKKGKDWIAWKTNFLMYIGLTKYNMKLKKQEEIFLLTNLMGDEAQKGIENMIFTIDEDKEDLNVLLRKFDELFIPTINEIEERYNFFSRRKLDGECIDNYVKDLREKAENCNFNNMDDDFIRDMIILNMRKHLQQTTFKKELSLQEVISLYKQYYVESQEKIKDIFNDVNILVNVESGLTGGPCDNNCMSAKELNTKSVCWRCSISHPQRACPAWGKRCEDCKELHHLTENCKNNYQRSSQHYSCQKCGTSHALKECPAYGATCSKCLKKNHYNSQCKNEAVIYIDKCDWCESKHLPGECPHDETCPMCDVYPHNICSQCQENPHIDHCIFKEVFTLPLLNHGSNKKDV